MKLQQQPGIKFIFKAFLKRNCSVCDESRASQTTWIPLGLAIAKKTLHLSFQSSINSNKKNHPVICLFLTFAHLLFWLAWL